jgi:hypothetical protein
MGESVNKIQCVSLVAYLIAIWVSYAKEDNESWLPITFPSEDGKPSFTQTSVARLTPRKDDSIVFAHDHDHFDQEDKHVTEGPKRNSLQVRS